MRLLYDFFCSCRFLMLPKLQITDSTSWKPKERVKYIKALKTYRQQFLPEEYLRTMEFYEGQQSIV